MNAGQKSAKRLATRTSYLTRNDTICTSCLHRLATTRHASTATAPIEQPTQPPPAPSTATHPIKSYAIVSSPLLSRPPLLTRPLTPFEQSFYLYQKRLNERLVLPFTRYFYDKKGTPQDAEWKRKVRVRKAAARDIGIYDAYGREGWDDEVKLGEGEGTKTGEWERMVENLVRDAEGRGIVEGEAQQGEEVLEAKGVDVGTKSEVLRREVERPMPRVTEADLAGDQRSLDRKLERTLYLLVRSKEGKWRFPEDRLYGRENVLQAAERILIQACGINMNTWLVASHPVGHYIHHNPSGSVVKIPTNRLVSTSKTELEREEFGAKVFFMKARIMAGQADLSKNEYGDQEYKWLCKEEVGELVEAPYWRAVRHMLAER